MTGFYFFPRNIYINMAQNSADSGLKLIMGNWRRYAYILHTLSKGVLCTFPALSFYCTQLLNQSIFQFLNCIDIWLNFFESTMYYFNLFGQSVYYINGLFLSFQENFNELCLIQRCNNFPVSTPAIPSTKVLQVWKNIKLEFTFSHQKKKKNASALNQSVTWNVD